MNTIETNYCRLKRRRIQTKNKHTNYREFFSTIEARSWADKHYHVLLHGAECKDLRDILYQYTGNLYKFINPELRHYLPIGGFPIEDVPFDDPELKEKAYKIQNALLSYSLPENIVVYRYTKKADVKASCGGRICTGAVLNDQAFLSTSLVKSCMKDFAKINEMNCIF